MNHRFIIGIGSQRAGSTLLHHLLTKASNVFIHPVKELHYFDTLYGYRSPKVLKDFSLRQMLKEIDRIVTAEDFVFLKDKIYKCYLRTSKILSIIEVNKIDYVDLFRPKLMQSSLLGEITPEYMLFDDSCIEKMKQIIGDDAGIILICRNPVKRILSAIKLVNVYNSMNMDDEKAETWFRRMLDEQSNWLTAQDQYNNYEDSIERYSRHFSNFLAISYDQLFSDPIKTAEQISQKVEIKINLDIFQREIKTVKNELGTEFKISEKSINELTSRYEASQKFINSYFGYEVIR